MNLHENVREIETQSDTLQPRKNKSVPAQKASGAGGGDCGILYTKRNRDNRQSMGCRKQVQVPLLTIFEVQVKSVDGFISTTNESKGRACGSHANQYH